MASRFFCQVALHLLRLLPCPTGHQWRPPPCRAHEGTCSSPVQWLPDMPVRYRCCQGRRRRERSSSRKSSPQFSQRPNMPCAGSSDLLHFQPLPPHLGAEANDQSWEMVRRSVRYAILDLPPYT